MKKALCLLLALTPSASFAFDTDRTLECQPGGNTPKSEQHVQLTILKGKDKGEILLDNETLDAQVLPSLEGFTLLHIGDGYTLNYDIDMDYFLYKYSGSGSKPIFGHGRCKEIES